MQLKNSLTRTQILSLCLFNLVNAVLLFRHEMWRDEAQFWLIVQSSEGLLDLWEKSAIEVRPLGWFLSLYVLSFFVDNFDAIKALTLVSYAIFSLSIVRIFPRVRSHFLVLTTFPVFGGYFVLSQDYGFGLALLFSALLFHHKSSRLKLLVLGIAANVNVFCLILGALGGAQILRHELGSRGRIPGTKKKLTLVAASLVWFVLQMASAFTIGRSRANPYNNEDAIQSLTDFRQAVITFFRLSFPLTGVPFGDHRGGAGLSVLGAVAGGLVILFLFRALGPKIFAFVFIAWLMFFLVFSFGYSHYWWHWGYGWPTIIFAIALAKTEQTSTDRGDILSVGRGGAHRNSNEGFEKVFLGLWIGSFIGIANNPTPINVSNYRYSGAQEAAAVLSTECPPGDCYLVGTSDYASTVSGYLDGEPIFYVSTGRFATYIDWLEPRARSIQPEEDLIAGASALSLVEERSTFFILPNESYPNFQSDCFSELYRGDVAVWRDEVWVVVEYTC